MTKQTMVDSPIWRPFTQMKTAPVPLDVVRGNGAWLELRDGRRILDCVSSWWVTIHGHAEPAIASAIYEQALKLEQVIFAGFTHEPAEKLATSILSVVPSSLRRIFFSDNGSTSVEVALKMAFQYWRNLGFTEKRKFIGFQNGYHGDTVGAMSMGGTSEFWRFFTPLLFAIDYIPFPATWDGDTTTETKEKESLVALEALLSESPDSYAAIIVEPLVQGAAGMRMCTAAFLRQLVDLARRYEVLVIYDEVMTGFGRTGDWFASTRSDTAPDILCLSKGLTGGFLPLALTLATEEIYQAFYADAFEKALFHSHSYTGNPIACAAANASFALLLQNQDSFRRMEQTHKTLIGKWITQHPKLHQARVMGTIAAFDMISDNESYFNAIGQTLKKAFIERNILVRPLGSTLYLLPPYCITDDELDFAYRTISAVCLEV
jgi:adenosylmethionine-8-amino-7-oxononanoate aminotransferase